MTLDPAQLERTLEQAYAPGQLPFCHDKGYQLRYSDRALCSLSEAEQQRCPALKRACGLASPDAPRKDDKREHQSQNQHDFSVAPWLAGAAEVLFWGLVLAVFVGALLALLQMRRNRGADEAEDEGADGAEPVPGDAPTASAATGDRDVQRLLDKARRAAERGELGAAIDAAHAAAVQGLSATGHIELERDRTNGDYLRDLKKTPPLHQDFKAIVGQVETAQFGGAPPTRGGFEQVLDRVMGLLRRLAVLSLWLGLAVSLSSCGARGETSKRETQETSPSGLYTFKRLLTDQGAKVHTRIAALGKLENVTEIVAFEPDLEPEERDLLLGWVRDGGTLVAVGGSDFLAAAGVEHRYATCGRSAERGPGQDEGRDEAPLELAVLGEQTLRLKPEPGSSVSHHVDAVCGGEPYVVTAFLGEGAITFIPEGELLSNASLSVGDNARLVAELFAVEPGGTIELVGSWTGVGSQSPIQSLKSAGLLPFIWQLLALALLLAVRQGTSFGARRDDSKRERRAFADHVRAVASTYARANAGRLVSGHYGLWLLEQLRERCCPGQSPTLFQLAATLARRTGRAEPQVVQLLVEAKASFDEGVEGQGINHKLIRELEQLSLQVGGVF